MLINRRPDRPNHSTRILECANVLTEGKTEMTIGRLILRGTVGGFFIGHGTQKLFGWFGGHGLDATAKGFESLGLRPGKTHATAAGIAEAGGGALLAAGLATPAAAAVLTATMLTAINRVHLKNGPWTQQGGYEYNAVLIGAAITLAEAGPGSLSLDHKLGIEKTGPKWGALALVAGIAGAVGAHVYAESQPAPAPEPPAAAAPTDADTPADAPGSATSGSGSGPADEPSATPSA
jgi:putative oxidoreductase